MAIVETILQYSGTVTAIPFVVAGLWGIIKFWDYIKDRKFKAYHHLIAELVDEQLAPDKKLKTDRQIAVIFELRNYSGYFPVTKRILQGLKVDWKDNLRVIEEIDQTIDFICRWWFVRKYRQLFKK